MVCSPFHVAPQPFMLDDIQNNAEYIANAIDVLYTTVCRPFPIQGWSQGNLASMLRCVPAQRGTVQSNGELPRSSMGLHLLPEHTQKDLS